MSLLSEKLKKGEFVVTSEVGPPKGANVEGMLEGAKQIGVRPDYLEKIEGWLLESIVAGSDEP